MPGTHRGVAIPRCFWRLCRDVTAVLEETETASQPLTSQPDLDLVKSPRTKFVSEDTLQAVRELLPAQPWPTGVHKIVAQALGISNGLASAAIRKLISRNEFKDQIGGKVIDSKV
jgi:hypothetical protein